MPGSTTARGRWEQLITTTTEILLEQGSRHSPTMAYSAPNELVEEQTGQPKFDFGLQQDRDAIGALLSDVNDRTLADVEAEMGRKVVLSGLVWHKDSPDLGRGLYDDASKYRIFNGRI